MFPTWREGHISVLSRLASYTARRQWLYLCHWCKRLSPPSPKSSAKGDEDHLVDVRSLYDSLDCPFNTLVLCGYSWWTSPSPWRWTFWMRRWRTAVKRRWAWNARERRCSRWFTRVRCYYWASAQQQLRRDILPLICALPSKGPTWLFFKNIFRLKETTLWFFF